MDEDLVQEAVEYSVTQSFGLQPWEYGEIPEYWIHRKALFERAFEKVRNPTREAEEES